MSRDNVRCPLCGTAVAIAQIRPEHSQSVSSPTGSHDHRSHEHTRRFVHPHSASESGFRFFPSYPNQVRLHQPGGTEI